ncbi:MAG TPA: glycosyltransferase family 1 protein, partial [Leeuwenhoekiella sp.]|nr:glycosyltransferase family 1 protein [Leeuwenhoekiella sp.]
TNMDGLEWKRTKFSKPVRRFIKFAESLAITTSDFLIADSIGIQEHLQSAYGATSKYIPYGAHVFKTPETAQIEAYDVAPYAYNMLVARLEPENSIEVILDGVVASGSPMPFLVIGNHNTAYGAYLKDKFKEATHIRFVGGVYNLEVLNNLRYYSNLYFHGHTVGGTNPSLLEAMASGALLVANDNIFNKSILGDEALYFSDASDVAESITKVEKKRYAHFVDRNRNKIEEVYSWELINKQYREYMLSCLAQASKVNQG